MNRENVNRLGRVGKGGQCCSCCKASRASLRAGRNAHKRRAIREGLADYREGRAEREKEAQMVAMWEAHERASA